MTMRTPHANLFTPTPPATRDPGFFRRAPRRKRRAALLLCRKIVWPRGVLAVLSADSEARYADAVARRALLLAEWRRLGEPLLGEGGATGRAVVPHPLMRMLSEADQLCDRLEKSLGLRGRGRPVGAASAADRLPPLVMLKGAGDGSASA